MSKIIHFETLGCKLNQVESEGSASLFFKAGFEISMSPYSAKTAENQNVILCVVNTCTVTAKAEQKARRIIRLLLSKCPQCAVLVTGCYAQNSKDEILAIDKRVCVLGGQYKGHLSEIPELLLKNDSLKGEELSAFIQKSFAPVYSSARPGEIQLPFKLVPDNFLHHSRSSLKIQDGCNCVCTYCAIRLARGKSVSIDAQEAIDRVKALEQAGQKEVVITTVNISQYRGKWKEGTVNFAGLLKLMLENTSTIRFRISSLYPEIVNEELASIVADPRVCPHFHISVQSGSDSVLARMKRPYKIEAVYRACTLLKKAKKNPFLACDIIAGFPGETDEDFDLTMKMLKECGFTFVHAFPFSARPGTEAYKMRPMVPNSVAGQRVEKLEEYNSHSKSEYIKSFEGQVLSAVCETVHRPRLFANRVVLHAVTENFLHCQLVFSKKDVLPQPGTLVQVKIRRPLNTSEVTGESDTLAELV